LSTQSIARQAIYFFVLIAALTRVLAALMPDWTYALLHVAAFTWIGAFGGLLPRLWTDAPAATHAWAASA